MKVHVCPQPGTPFEERLWTRIVKGAEDACWEWTGPRTAYGYGRIARGGRGGGVERTHRAVWRLIHGPIPDGLCVLHRCDNPPCCNPAHLFLGTLGDNTQDMLAKGRNRPGRGKPGQNAGEDNPNAKLTDAQVAELRRLVPEVGNYAELGRCFGITKQHTRQIALGRWR